MMVELECGAALAVAYGDILKHLQCDDQLSWTRVNVDMLLQWKNNLL